MRAFLWVSIGLMLLCGLSASGSDAVTPVRFAIIGDRTGSAQPGIHEAIVAEVARMRPDFIVNVGDMIEGYYSDSLQTEKAWDEYDAIVKPLPARYYRVPGNHDIWDAPSERIYQRRVGPPYHSFDEHGLHFIVLDASRWERTQDLPAEQLAWLAQDLAAHLDARYTFVLFHKPFWYSTLAAGQPDTLHTLFMHNGVDCVFNGHFHEYFTATYDGVRYTAIGSSGGAADTGPFDWCYHFAWVTVEPSGIYVAPIKLGSVLAWDDITVGDRKRIEAIKTTSLRMLDALSVMDGAMPTGPITVQVTNPAGCGDLADTLRWDIPAGWTIEPATTAVNLPSGASATLRFDATCRQQLYPAPQAVLSIPFLTDKTISVSRPLRTSRNVICASAEQPPEIDGLLDEPCWRNPIRDLFAPEGGPTAAEPVSFYFAHDARYLYLGVICKDRALDGLQTNAADRDGAVTSDDCVGYFFEPDHGSREIFQIYLSAAGVIFDQRIWSKDDGYPQADRDWNGEVDVVTALTEAGWTMEARVAARSLGGGAAMAAGDTWRLNFRRKQPRLGNADWQVPIDYDASTYGLMRLE